MFDASVLVARRRSAAILMMVSSIGLSWASSYVAYVLTRFCMGASYGGTSCGFIIGIHTLDNRYTYSGFVYIRASGTELLGFRGDTMHRNYY